MGLLKAVEYEYCAGLWAHYSLLRIRRSNGEQLPKPGHSLYDSGHLHWIHHFLWFLSITLFPAAMTPSFVNPNSFCTALIGAEAPKVPMPTCSPSIPVKKPQDSRLAASIDTRARHVDGKMLL
eukprot:gnl/MRDRNA2_/MRDRNA2_143350_c0_seq1.p1 gnl/MRDRNA2_/MRDRNA2_143350_c0~~gnl/MRDRNA2_/MRDRNA2_143350_c0_seq1.p1  ORF type:complete len:123 (-),score=3.37 gnl/MRDRNA2_/MRDRNA2_143350_c0_seq1:42-410(-)